MQLAPEQLKDAIRPKVQDACTHLNAGLRVLEDILYDLKRVTGDIPEGAALSELLGMRYSLEDVIDDIINATDYLRPPSRQQR